jgi:hypothetical protein
MVPMSAPGAASLIWHRGEGGSLRHWINLVLLRTKGSRGVAQPALETRDEKRKGDVSQKKR